MSNRHKAPAFTWGAAFANVLRVGYPLDNVQTGSEPRPGYETAQAPSGVEDAWDAAEDYVLEAEIRWVPLANTAAPVATGWDGATGLFEFLRWAAVGRNQVRFYPSYADLLAGTGMVLCTVIEPTRAMADSLEPDGTRRLRLKLRSASTAFAGY